MDWVQFTVFIITMCGLFIKIRSESIEHIDEIKKQLSEERKQTRAEMRTFRSENLFIIQSIQQEIKDFHGRLCAIEERTKGYK